jgi:hypothetical protein
MSRSVDKERVAALASAADRGNAEDVIRNNILRSTRAGAVVATGPGITYSNNLLSPLPAAISGSAPLP